MLALRPFKNCDAEKIASWCKDEQIFKMWGGELFGEYPLTSDKVIDLYVNRNGRCEESDNFYPLTAIDEDGAVGHLIMRYIKGDHKFIRFGWVIVDNTKRGKGYGKKMMLLAFKYAFEILQADKVCLGVFENNPNAYHCYKAAGFRPSTDLEDSFMDVGDEKWKVIELEITREEYEANI